MKKTMNLVRKEKRANGGRMGFGRCNHLSDFRNYSYVQCAGTGADCGNYGIFRRSMDGCEKNHPHDFFS